MISGHKKVIAARTAVALLVVACATSAQAHGAHHHVSHIARHGGARAASYSRRSERVHLTGGAHVLQCVAFAKQDAGIQIAGNARDWWGNAAGIYERGYRPENGSVLSFSANGRMPLGHVAVVSGVQDSRTILIDQSHWNSRGISRDIEVKDVSESNDWSAVRVALSHGGAFGSIYPTHGFIYPRPDRGALQINLTHAPMPTLMPAPGDLRRSRARSSTEVAEAVETGKPLDLRIAGLSFDSPSRALR